MIVRKLARADAEAFRVVRLECLRLNPGAFGSTLADWEPKPLQHYEARIEDGVLFGLFSGPTLSGVLAYDRERGGNARHRAGIHAVYVREALRGQGGIDALIAAAVAQAREDGVVQLELAVSADNARARDAYLRNGFMVFGQIPRALQVGGRHVDQMLLIRMLD